MADAILTPAACVNGVAAVLATVSGIGIVHKYRRIVRTEGDAKRLYVPDGSDDNHVNAWMVSMAGVQTAVSERQPGFRGIGVAGGGRVRTTFRVQIEALASIVDAEETENSFRDLVWLVAATLNTIGMMNVVGLIHQRPADVLQFGYQAIAGSLFYHYGRIELGLEGFTQLS